MYTIYSKDKCPQCDAAKMLLVIKGIDHEVLKLDVDFTREEFVELFPKARTFPMITKDGEHVGGLQDLKEILK